VHENIANSNQENFPRKKYDEQRQKKRIALQEGSGNPLQDYYTSVALDISRERGEHPLPLPPSQVHAAIIRFQDMSLATGSIKMVRSHAFVS
jgi:hypothetical protein